MQVVGDDAGRESVRYQCSAPGCVALVVVGRRDTKIRVEGQDSREVQDVARHLAEDEVTRREAARLRSPWFSGLFYLATVVVITAVLLAAGRVLALWALPVVIVGVTLLVSTVGALQLRQDDHLSGRAFVRLMGDVLRRLPLLPTRRPDHQDGTGGTA
jgi:hypothetical protein